MREEGEGRTVVGIESDVLEGEGDSSVRDGEGSVDSSVKDRDEGCILVVSTTEEV